MTDEKIQRLLLLSRGVHHNPKDNNAPTMSSTSPSSTTSSNSSLNIGCRTSSETVVHKLCPAPGSRGELNRSKPQRRAAAENPSKRRKKSDNAPPLQIHEQPSWQNNTLHTGPNDVILGRGGKINALVGNKKFRYLASGLKSRYSQAADSHEKTQITKDIVTLWRNLDPPGRFLKESENEPNTWYDVGDEHARTRTAQLVRSNTLASSYAKELGTEEVELLDACIQSLLKKSHTEEEVTKDSDGRNQIQMKRRDHIIISKSLLKKSHTEEEGAKDSDRSGHQRNNMKGKIFSGNTNSSNVKPQFRSESKTSLSNPTQPLRASRRVAPRVAHLLRRHENQPRHSHVSFPLNTQVSPPPRQDAKKSPNKTPQHQELAHQSILSTKAKAQAKLKKADVSVPGGQPGLEASAKPKKLPKRWSQEEDSQLRQMVERYISSNQRIKWVAVAEGVSTRTGKQCRERWLCHLQPGVNKSNFTLEEDRALQGFRQKGCRWNEIERLMPGRNCNDVKNRWHRLERARKKIEKLGRIADTETIHRIVNGRGGMDGANNNARTSACDVAKVEENEDVTDQILDREDSVRTEECTLSEVPEVGMKVRVRFESDDEDKNEDCYFCWGTITNISPKLADLKASMDIDELANILSSGRHSSMSTGNTGASVLKKFNITIKYISGITEECTFPHPDIQLMSGNCTLTEEERSLSNELLNLGGSLSMKETHAMKKKNSDEVILRTNVEASQDYVPLETVRRLLLGDLDPVELAKSLLPSDEVALVEKRWRKR